MRRSYLAKLLVMIIGLVVTLQLVTLMTSRAIIRDTVLQNANRELQVGSTLFKQLTLAREFRLQERVKSIASDPAFKRAFANGDSPGLRGALAEISAFSESSYQSLIDNRLVSSTDGVQATEAFPFPELLRRAQDQGTALAAVVVDGRPYYFVAATIEAPSPIGWLVVGFDIDSGWAENLKQLTGLEVSFLWKEGEPITTLHTEVAQHLKGLLLGESFTVATQPSIQTLGQDRILTMVMLLDSGKGGVSAVLQLPMSNILAPYHRLNDQLLWLTLIGGLISAAIAVLFARRLTRSVTSLARASQRIEGGDYNTALSVVSEDELGRLARAFNKMQLAIAEREERILYQSQHDYLTGLANRSYALRKLQQVIGKAQLTGVEISVVVLDLTRFKAINDSFGHRVGDEVLQAVAKRIQASVKKRDTVVRLNADEYMVILDPGGDEQARIVADHLSQRLAKPIKLPELQLTLEVTIGIASYAANADTPETLMRRADLAKYSAQEAGQHIALYQEGDDELHLRRLELLRDLKQGLQNNDLKLYFQPKMGVSNPNDFGAEALVRWHHPAYGDVSPEEFVPLVESSGNIALLTRWVLEAAVTQLGQWIAKNYKLLLSVNISALDLLEEDLPDYIAGLLQRHSVPAESLCLELTEGAIMKEAEQGMAMLQRLKAMGIRLSIDDFGTGYSSLAQLKKLPFDELKIDKSFVLQLHENSDDEVIVRSTIELGHNMGLKITAEGVENEEIRLMLAEWGCDLMQGYLVSKPLPCGEFEQWLFGRLEETGSSAGNKKVQQGKERGRSKTSKVVDIGSQNAPTKKIVP